jgi:hypothetical protein
MRATHSQRLERWLGTEAVENLAESMRDWYGPPIAVSHVPGKVYVTKGGDFRGHIEAGSEASLFDKMKDHARRIEANVGQRFNHWLARQQEGLQLNTGFASLSDLISEAAAGKKRLFSLQKAGTTGVVAATNSLWAVGNQPVAGANGAAAPGGTAHVDSDTGSFTFVNPTGGDTQHFTSAQIMASVAGNQLLMYDRLFSVAKTMNSTATESVTGVPTRYQNTTSGNQDSADGNFVFVECTTVLPATAHNWTTCLYTDQNGNASSTLPSLTGNSSNIVNRLDHPTSQWFAPLASGDTGIKELDQMQCSATVATGAINFVIGHPIGWIACPLANIMLPTDAISGSFQLERVYDDACLAFLEVAKSATGATTYTGSFTTVAG